MCRRLRPLKRSSERSLPRYSNPLAFDAGNAPLVSELRPLPHALLSPVEQVGKQIEGVAGCRASGRGAGNEPGNCLVGRIRTILQMTRAIGKLLRRRVVDTIRATLHGIGRLELRDAVLSFSFFVQIGHVPITPRAPAMPTPSRGGPTLRSRSVFLTIQEWRDNAFKALGRPCGLRIVPAVVHEQPTPIDREVDRDTPDAAISAGVRATKQTNRKAQTSCDLPNSCEILRPVQAEPKNTQAFRRMTGRILGQQRKFGPAWLTPCSPERQDDDIPTQIIDGDALPVERMQNKARRRATDGQTARLRRRQPATDTGP